MSVLEHKCIECGEAFTITDEEQAFFKSKNFSLPKRCKPCRKARKLAKQQGEGGA